MKKAFKPAVAGIIISLFVIAAAIAVHAAGFEKRDLMLMRAKCTKCHTLKRVVRDMPRLPVEKRIKVIHEMSEKKPGFISGNELKTIVALLSAKDLSPLFKALEDLEKDLKKETEQKKEEKSEEDEENSVVSGSWFELMKISHGILQAFAFMVFGLYMIMSGLKRYFMEIKKFKNFPVKFNRKEHIRWGKIYVVLTLVGFCGGLAIWGLDGFDFGGALAHFAAGSAVALLFVVGGLGIGSKLAQGKQPQSLKTLHMIMMFVASALFIFNIVTGILLVFAG